jgi:hypothetical protein
VNNDAIERIENHEKLLEMFSGWPSFHDAEVIGIELNREGPNPPVLTLNIYVFSLSSALNEQGHFVKSREAIVTFEFFGVGLDHIDGFNAQNVLSSLRIASKPGADTPRLQVGLVPLYGVSAEFSCDRGAVRAVQSI